MKAILLGRTDRATDTIPYAQLFPFFDNKKRRGIRNSREITILV